MAKVSHKTHIGVSLNDSSIEMVEVRINHEGQGEIITASHAALPKGVVEHGKVKNVESLGVALRAAFETADPQPFSHKNIHFSLPDLVSYFHTFYFPGSLNEEEIENALAFQLEEVIPFHPDEMKGVHHVVSRSERTTVVTYAMALREDLAAYRQAFKTADLQIASIGLATQALSRMIPVKDESDPTATVVIDVENVAAALCLFDKNGLRATFSQLFKKPNQPHEITDPLKENFERKQDIRDRVQKKPALLRGSGLTKTQLDRLVYRLKEIISWFVEKNPEERVGTILLVGESEKRAELEQAIIKAYQKHTPPIAIGIGNLFEAFVGSSIIDQNLGAQRGALLAEACGIAVMAAAPRARDFNLAGLSGEKAKGRYAPGLLSIFKRTQYDASGMKISEMTVVRYRRRAALVGTFFVLALAVLTTAITLRVRQDVSVSAHQEEILNQRAQALLEIKAEPFDHIISVAAQEAPQAVLGRRIVMENFSHGVPVQAEQIAYTQARASGSLEIRNAASQEVTLIANTRLQSADGQLFRLQKEVTVGANSSAHVQVYADQPGVQGNVEPTTFTVPGLSPELQPLVTGVSRAPMTGGLVIESADQAYLFASAEDLTTQYIADHLAEVLKLDESEIVLPEWYRLTPGSVRFIQAEEGQISVEVSLQIEALVFSGANLDRLVQEAIAKKTNREIEEIDQAVAYEPPIHYSIAEDFSQGKILVKVGRYPHVSETE